jgi:hypothetical protein
MVAQELKGRISVISFCQIAAIEGLDNLRFGLGVYGQSNMRLTKTTTALQKFTWCFSISHREQSQKYSVFQQWVKLFISLATEVSI